LGAERDNMDEEIKELNGNLREKINGNKKL
jgi:hypothetical protein